VFQFSTNEPLAEEFFVLAKWPTTSGAAVPCCCCSKLAQLSFSDEL
jgi:hypothetical protein